jgi:hypothetical protein
MKGIMLCVLLSATGAFAEVDKAQLDLFKKESAPLRSAIDGVIGSGRESTKATYLEGYGAIFTVDASLGPTRSPFSSVQTPAEVRAIVAAKRNDVETKLTKLLKDRAGALQSLGSTESVTIVVYLFNSTPVDVPDLPSQIVFTAKKQDPAQVLVLPRY